MYFILIVLKLVIYSIIYRAYCAILIYSLWWGQSTLHRNYISPVFHTWRIRGPFWDSSKLFLLSIKIIESNFFLNNLLLFLLPLQLFELLFVLLLTLVKLFFNVPLLLRQLLTPIFIKLLKLFHSILKFFFVLILFFLHLFFLFCLDLFLGLNVSIGSHDTCLFDIKESIQLVFFLVHFSHDVLVKVRHRSWKRIRVFVTLEGLSSWTW